MTEPSYRLHCLRRAAQALGMARTARATWPSRTASLALVAALAGALAPLSDAGAQTRLRNGDYIAVIVNQELVTAGEIDRRVERAQGEAARGARLPPEPELRRLTLDALIDERVMISSARESGMRVDDGDVDRAIQSIAAQNQITLPVLRQRLAAEGTDYFRFRANIREQIMIERLREREVYQRIRVSDEEIDKFLEEQRAVANADAETNLAQILVTVPEDADAATVAARRAVVELALARVKNGEPFETVAREVSEDANRAQGGVIGARPASRRATGVRTCCASVIFRKKEMSRDATGAGFHLLKVVSRKEAVLGQVQQTRARHVLLRTSPQLTAEVAARRLSEYRRQIESGSKSFEAIAREFSEDGSASAGGDLGWASPGVMVPEFEQAMNALAVNGISEPVMSRFGVHLIQVLERREQAVELKQLREQARNVLREQRFDQAYADWTKELRSRAYVEYREPPQ